jgi:hypothetical protein
LNPAILLSVAGFACVRRTRLFVIRIKGAAATVQSLDPAIRSVVIA